MSPNPLLSRILAPSGCADPARLRQAVEGKTVLVTGASFGIGAALCVRLGAAGARVLLAARSTSELEALRDTIVAAGGEAHCYVLDLMEPLRIAEVAERILSEQGHVDTLVHNAGKSIRRSLYRSLDRHHDFQRTMAVNYLGPVQLQLALLPSMIARRCGQIINVSSVGVRIPPAAYWAAYICSKSAFDQWLGAAVPELRHSNIDCTRIYFGLVHTRMSAPTEAYASMPGQTPDQAAYVICRALIERPRSIAPWWLGPVHWMVPPFERLFEWIQYRFQPPDPALSEFHDRLE